jgi:chromosome partitioning protein
MTAKSNKKAHIIVVSNEKGGTGKSTISMHLAIKLLNEGFTVATIDLDGRQGTLSKYIENRQHFCQTKSINLPTPQHHRFAPQEDTIVSQYEVCSKIHELTDKFDAVIIDTPGTKNYLFDIAHVYADTLITPISDSLIDLNVMADIDFANNKVKKPGHYANFIWDTKKQLAAKGKPYLNWIVVGNKISSYNSNNKKQVFSYLEQISKIYGFRLLGGLKDRVIYKELFLEGLTVLDMQNDSLKYKMNMSHLAAKREVRSLAEFICPE